MNIHDQIRDALPDIDSYDKVLIAFSGGKDSVACFLALLKAGVPKERIELWHQEVDGRDGSRLMDWPCTPGYCRAFAKAFGIPIYFAWREGGFEREMLRNQTATARTLFEVPGGHVMSAGGAGKPNTRLMFPQVSADLTVRWCSSYLKIDVASIAIRNQARFSSSRTLYVSGERAEESPARARYKVVEPHRSHLVNEEISRFVTHFRPVHGWTEQQVLDILKLYSINPHPAYRLGWGRVSCALCIFGNANQWASARRIMPNQFNRVNAYEVQFSKTIQRKQSVTALADKGTPCKGTQCQKTVAESMDHDWNGRIILPAGDWKLPAGAFGESNGPI